MTSLQDSQQGKALRASLVSMNGSINFTILITERAPLLLQKPTTQLDAHKTESNGKYMQHHLGDWYRYAKLFDENCRLILGDDLHLMRNQSSNWQILRWEDCDIGTGVYTEVNANGLGEVHRGFSHGTECLPQFARKVRALYEGRRDPYILEEKQHILLRSWHIDWRLRNLQVKQPELSGRKHRVIDLSRPLSELRVSEECSDVQYQDLIPGDNIVGGNCEKDCTDEYASIRDSDDHKLTPGFETGSIINEGGDQCLPVEVAHEGAAISKVSTDTPSLNGPLAPSHPVTSLFALIIGINDYEHIPKLSGCVADAQDMIAYLTQDLGVHKTRIIQLFDQDATRDRIVEELKALGQNEAITKNSPILIYYAGHGGRAKAPHGWPVNEKDDRIEMLLPHNFNPRNNLNEIEQGIPDITLGSLLNKLSQAKGNNITVILDSCHSASGTRNWELGPQQGDARGVKLPGNYQILPCTDSTIRAKSRSAIVSPDYKGAASSSHVLLTACSKYETANELNGRGWFTQALMCFLRDSNTQIDAITPHDLLKRLPDLIWQHPHCEGRYSKRRLFNGMVKRAAHVLHHVKCFDNDIFSTEAYGVQESGRFDIHPAKPLFSSGPSIRVIASMQVEGYRSNLNFTLSDPKIALRPGSAAWALKTRSWEEVHLKVSITSHESPSEDYDLAASRKGRSAVFHIGDKACNSAGLHRLPESVSFLSDDVYGILDSAADFFWHLRRGTSNPGSTEVELRAWELAGTTYATLTPIGVNLNSDNIIKVQVEDGLEKRYGFKIVNKSDKRLYAWLFSFNMSDLSIDTIYQPSFSKVQNNVDPCIPAGGELTIGYGSGGAEPQSFFLSHGIDVDVSYFKLFISTKRVDLSYIKTPSPFLGNRANRPNPLSQEICDNVLITVIQKRKNQPGRCM